MLPADKQAPVGTQPSETPFHCVPEPIVLRARDDGSSTFGSPFGRAALRRDAHRDAAPSQRATPLATIISPIRHQLVGPTLETAVRASNLDRLHGVLGELDLRVLALSK
jgi:hypothetical protein